jgi:hypothetical protein
MTPKFALPLACAAALLAGAAVAQPDHEAGVPLSPGEAAGGWTVETGGHAVCMITLSAARVGASAYGATPKGDCRSLIPAGVAGWTPTRGGMALTDQSGQVLLPFDRWSNSLFVAKISTGDEVQLMRGGPHPQG